MQNIAEYKHKDILNIFLIACAVMVETIQLIIIAVLVSERFPIDGRAFISQNLEREIPNLHLDRQVWLFRFFVIIGIGLALAIVYFFRNRFKDEGWIKGVTLYLYVQGIIAALQVFACFKVIVYKGEAWTWWLLWPALAAGIACRLFWPELRKVIECAYSDWLTRELSWWQRRWMDVVAVLMIIGCVYAPKLAAFKYEMRLAVLYFVACYFFLRIWLKSGLLAAFGALLALKLQLFNTSVMPAVWLLPQKTFLRYFWDMAVFLSLWRHMDTGDRRVLWLASVMTGVALIYMPDTGLMVLAALYLYLIFQITLKTSIVRAKMFFITPVVVAVGLWFLHGKPAFVLPVWPAQATFLDCLRASQFFAFVMAFIIPLVYVITVLVIGTRIYFKKADAQSVFALILSVYGLGLYQYFVWSSTLNNYYAVAVAFVCVICFWLKRGLNALSLPMGRIVLLGAVVAVLLGLLGNPIFLYYHTIATR